MTRPRHLLTHSIKETFEEEKTMDLVEGPFTKQETPNWCGCHPSWPNGIYQ